MGFFCIYTEDKTVMADSPYTHILHNAREELGLSVIEYCVADTICHLSISPISAVPGWCYMSRPRMAALLGISRRSIFNIIDRLTQLGLVVRQDDSGYLKTTNKWYRATAPGAGAKSALPSAKIALPSAKSALRPVQKLHYPSAKIAPNNNSDINKDINSNSDFDLNKFKQAMKTSHWYRPKP